MVLVDRLIVRNNKNVNTQNIIMLFVGVLFITLASKISIPFYPVPITGQTFAIILVSIAYGKKMGFGTVLSYVMIGLSGMPVFANGGGIVYLFGPTGGYLIGFLLASYFLGYCAEKGLDRSIFKLLIAILIAEILIYIPGLLVLSIYVKQNILSSGLYPFLLGDMLKILTAVLLLPSIWKILENKK